MASSGNRGANLGQDAKRGARPDKKPRAERLAEALRANLGRRKAQARGRAGDEAASSGKAGRASEDKED